MSIVIPVVELASAFLGGLVALGTTRVTGILPSAHKRAKSRILIDELAKSERWHRFSDDRLKSIVADRAITETEWKEIIQVLEQASVEVVSVSINGSASSDFLSRSEKSKKLVASGVIQEIYG